MNLSASAKAVVAFISLVVTNLLVVVSNPATDAVLPQSATQWITAVLTTVAGTLAVWAKSNTPSTP